MSDRMSENPAQLPAETAKAESLQVLETNCDSKLGKPQLISTDRIIGVKLQTRPVDPDSLIIEELAEDIELNGQIAPIVVQRKHDTPENYEIIDGNHRFEACKRLGRPVNAYVLDADNPIANEIALSANFKRAEMSPAGISVTMLYASKEYDLNPLVSASGQKLGLAAALSRTMQKSKQGIQSNLNAGMMLESKMDGLKVFLEISHTPFDSYGRIRELATNPAWTPSAIRKAIADYKALSPAEQDKYQFPSKKAPKDQAKTSKEGDNNFSTLLDEEDRQLGRDAQNFMLMIQTWNLATDKTRTQFMLYLQQEFDGGQYGPINPSDARSVI